ncbi:MAG: hypothetical protein PWP11_2993 [Thauera sp.]|nr:hypothetical protein [Thauera sp.]MDI3491716.1 hypothetical protein [Thauera sp.]
MTAAVHDMLKAKAAPPPPEPWPLGLSGSIADLIGTAAPDVHWFAHFPESVLSSARTRSASPSV